MAEPRLRMPAFAKSLLQNRRRGFHPLRVEVWYGDDWSEAAAVAKREAALLLREGAAARPYAAGAAWLKLVGDPMLAIRPGDFAPGNIDWRCVTGLQVRVIDGCRALDDIDFDEAGRVTRWGLIYFLLGDISRAAAEVLYCSAGARGIEECVDDLAFGSRVWDAARRAFVWPEWWPVDDEVREARERRKITWYRFAGECTGARV